MHRKLKTIKNTNNMKTLLLSTLISLFIFQSCQNQPKEKSGLIEENVTFSAEQYSLQTALIEESGKILNPKSFIDGKMKYINPQEWTSGFFPGSMWYLYELTGDEKWKQFGIKYTEALDTVQYLTNHHDVGFMIGAVMEMGCGWRKMKLIKR